MKNFVTPNIKNSIITQEMVKGRNCENFIGAIQVPLGLAGPLRLKTEDFPSKEFYLPLSTTEGALVASVNRGCKAITLSGGALSLVENVGATRGPLFRVGNLSEGKKFTQFVFNNYSKIKQIAAAAGGSHLKLSRIEPQILGKNVWLRFYFDTGEAMGMNMATVATEKITHFLENQTKAKCLSLSGNFCSDKKTSWSSFLLGRGKKVWVESLIKKDIVKEVLKSSPEKIVEIVRQKSHLGSIMTGSLGFNAHFANIIAAIFLATGQDLGHIGECSMGITDAEIENNGDLYFTVYLPDLMVGTVGGGTGLPTQSEALEILGLNRKKEGDSLILAQVIGGAVLAGELSLTAALAAGDLAKAHQKLGRGKK